MEYAGRSALIAMSGGVDSSVAAYLMMQKGCSVSGVTMRLYRNEDIGLSSYHTCCSQKDIDDAEEVAFRLDIPFDVPDYTAAFKANVIDKFVRIYEEGGTPNPCIDCNRYMKFEKLLSYADEHGLDYVVTGHYARIEYDEERGRYLLKKAVYADKDQSYVLYMLTQEQLSRICFPLGGLQKSEVREIAESIGFRNARKHDSQDICFVPNGDYASFIEKYTGKTQQEGSFLNVDGERIGTHKGAIRYTTGQRKGLGIALGEPAYVISKDMANNTVTLGREEYLFSDTVYVNDLNWISVPDLTEPMRVKAKIRYRQQEQPATISPAEDGKVMIKFDAPQRAATAGQAAVFYDGDIVVGGGCICGVGDTNA